MKFIRTAIPDILIMEPDVYADERGWFSESYNQRVFYQGLATLDLNQPEPFVQDNHSCSKKGVIRGLHYQQNPFAQGKLIRVTQGSIFDIAVDLRNDSPTLGHHVSVELSAENGRILWLPAGFAHGFLALDDRCHTQYKTTSYYHKDSEVTIRWDDPALNICWPLTGNPIISEKDRQGVLFKDAPRFHAS